LEIPVSLPCGLPNGLTKLLTNSPPYTFVRRGYFYFSRRVPSDLQSHYACSRIVHGLRTRSPQRAKSLADVAAAQLDAYWTQIRLAQMDVPGMAFVKSRPKTIPLGLSRDVGQAIEKPDDCPAMSDAVDLYLRLRGNGRPKTFAVDIRRAAGYLTQLAQDRPLSSYSRQDALALRDWLVGRGLAGSSVTRAFSNVNAVFNFAVSELALNITNPFRGVYHDRQAGVVIRKPIPVQDIRKVQQACRDLNDDMRWLIAIVSDTGMRLAEVAGLAREDLCDLDGPMPYLKVQRHPWRGLKTTSSDRLVPLVGEAFWGARQAYGQGDGSAFLFPRYNRAGTTSANSASAALNKWMGEYVPDGCTMHSFRHSMRDRLRAVQCPSDITDQIGGWARAGVGQGYGTGYPLEILHHWMKKVS
jgi:integrase